MAGCGPTSASTVCPEDDVRTGVDGKVRPSSSEVRTSPTTGARRPRWPHTAHAQPGWSVPHHPQRGGAAARGMASGPGRPSSGRRCGSARRPAPRRTRARGVCTSTGPVFSASPTTSCTSGGHPGAAGERVARELGVAGPGDPHGDPVAQPLARHGQLVGPAGAEQVVGLDRAGEPAQQRGGALTLGAQQQRLAGVRVRRPRLGVQVVTVVPDHHQTQVVHGREGRRTGADHDPASTAGDGQEVAVAPGRARLRGQRRRAGPSPSTAVSARSTRATSLASGTHSSDAAARAGVRRRGGVGEQHRPVRPRAVPPTRPAGSPAARRRRYASGLRVLRPRGLGRGRRRTAGGSAAGAGSAALGGGVPRRHREAQHVAAGAGVARGHVAGQRRHAGAEHRLGADHPAQRGQPAGVVGTRRRARRGSRRPPGRRTAP